MVTLFIYPDEEIYVVSKTLRKEDTNPWKGGVFLFLKADYEYTDTH
jgi:hypothetical protein